MIRLCNQTLMIKRAQMNLQKLYIYGHGGHGRVVADIAVAAGYRDIRFLDDAHGQKFDAGLPKGNIIVTVGDNAVRQRLGQKVSAAGFRLVSLIHPAAVVSPSAVVAAGVVVMPQAVINNSACIGEGSIINTAAVVEHDCIIGAYAHVCPNVALAGGVYVGERVQVGIGSCVIQDVRIGAGSMIGAGSVVVRDLEADVVAFGNPARACRKL